jgi:hypothetical protein
MKYAVIVGLALGMISLGVIFANASVLNYFSDGSTTKNLTFNTSGNQYANITMPKYSNVTVMNVNVSGTNYIQNISMNILDDISVEIFLPDAGLQGTAANISKMNDSLTSKNLTSPSPKYIYFTIPRNVTMTNATMNITGFAGYQIGEPTGFNISVKSEITGVNYYPTGITTETVSGTNYFFVLGSSVSNDEGVVFRYYRNGTYTGFNFTTTNVRGASGITTDGTYFYITGHRFSVGCDGFVYIGKYNITSGDFVSGFCGKSAGCPQHANDRGIAYTNGNLYALELGYQCTDTILYRGIFNYTTGGAYNGFQSLIGYLSAPMYIFVNGTDNWIGVPDPYSEAGKIYQFNSGGTNIANYTISGTDSTLMNGLGSNGTVFWRTVSDGYYPFCPGNICQVYEHYFVANYTSNIIIDTGNDGTADYSYPGFLSTSQSVNLNTTAIQNFLNSCATSVCTVPVKVSANYIGNVLVSNINIVYNIINPISGNTTAINNYLLSCTPTVDNCTLPIKVTSGSAGIFSLTGLNLTYFIYPRILQNYTTPTAPYWNANVTATVNVSDDNLQSVNFTVQAPNGTLMLNNVNGTQSGALWTSSAFNTNVNGSWNVSVLARDDDGYTASTSWNFSIDLGVIEFMTQEGSGTRSFPQLSGDTTLFNITLKTLGNSNNTINFTLTDDLANTTKFITILSSNSTILEPNVLQRFEVNITSNVSLTTGNYSGYIIATRDEDGNVSRIAVNITISLLSGRIDIYQTAFALSLVTGSSDTRNFTIQNTGNYNLTNCSVSLITTASVGFSCVNTTGFDIENGTNLTDTCTFTGVGASTDNGAILTVTCVATPTGVTDVDSIVGSISIISLPTPTPGGGGPGQAQCGNGYCEVSETVDNCPQDCFVSIPNATFTVLPVQGVISRFVAANTEFREIITILNPNSQNFSVVAFISCDKDDISCNWLKILDINGTEVQQILFKVSGGTERSPGVYSFTVVMRTPENITMKDYRALINVKAIGITKVVTFELKTFQGLAFIDVAVSLLSTDLGAGIRGWMVAAGLLIAGSIIFIYGMRGRGRRR